MAQKKPEQGNSPPTKSFSISCPAQATQQEREALVAGYALDPATAATRVIVAAEGQGGLGHELAPDAIRAALQQDAARVHAGDMTQVETMLLSQATALQTLSARLTERAMAAGYIPQLDVLLRYALRAQAQSRQALEALATVKNPPVVIAKQANISQGHQQIINNAHTRTAETEIRQNELLGQSDGERLDSRTAATASGTDTAMATVGAVNRPPDSNGQAVVIP